MNVNNNLIDSSDKNWPELLSGWMPPLPTSFTVWLVNRFGDLFVIFDDGSVHMLDVNTGALARVANDRNDFADQIDRDDNANNWLMIPLVDQCVAAGPSLRPDQSYGYRVPPILGGEYSVENVVPIDLAVNYSLTSDICRQVEKLPGGTRVRLVIAPAPEGTAARVKLSRTD